MIWELVINLLDVLRAIAYGWALFECIFLMYLYGMASRQMKKTPIIRSVHLLFLTLTIYFGVLTSMPLYKFTAPTIYAIGVRLLVIPVVFVAMALRIFRVWSLETPVSSKFDKFVKRVARAKRFVRQKSKEQAKN